MAIREIPRILWQTHEVEYSDLPSHFLATSMTWRNLNPTWEYRYASADDRSRRVEKFDRNLHKFYLLADKVTQADIWRYLVVFETGGVYADMDSVCRVPLDYLINTYRDQEDLIATAPNNQEGINNANFGAIPNSELLEDIISGIRDNQYQLDFYHMFLESDSKEVFWERIRDEIRTSPDDYSKVLKKNLDKVCFIEDWAFHGNDFKDGFKGDYMVNYYGTLTPYSKLAANNNWTV